MITQEERPHLSFLEQRGYICINKNNRNFNKYQVFIGFSADFKRCIIIRKNQLRPDGGPRNVFHVVYKGAYPFDMPEFAEVLFKKLKLDFIPKHKRDRERVYSSDELTEALEDMDTILRY